MSVFALSLLAASVYAASPTINSDDLAQVENAPIVYSPFNYVTIQELLAIDEKRALENERQDAEKIGLIQPPIAVTAPAQASSIESTDEAKEKDEDAKKQTKQKDSPAQLSQALNPQLLGIYGVGNQLSALINYGGFSYRFISGHKQNQRSNQGNTLFLSSIKDRCVNLYDSTLNTPVNVCLGGVN